MKKIFTISAIAFLIVHGSMAQVSLTSGLMAYYTFSGNAKDSSEFKAEGSITNATQTADRFGKPNSAYYFSGINSFITIPAENLDLSAYTYSLWVRATELPGHNEYNCALSIGAYGSDQAIGICKECAGGDGWNYISYPSISFLSAVMPSVDRWYHLVATRVDQRLVFYVDGVVVGGAGGQPVNSNPGLTGTIGARYTKEQLFTGDIDDLRIYNRALNAEEVKALFNMESQIITNTKRSLENDVSVFPNPNNGNFNIHSNLSIPTLDEVLIKDITGKVIKSSVNQIGDNNIQIDFAGDAGLYFLEYKDSYGTKTVKFIKN